MRLWSIHPKYLDHKGLVALWREALLARKVLQGRTEGYKNHPQLTRFRKTRHPVHAIDNYLKYVLEEALDRGYNFDRSKVITTEEEEKIPVTVGQMEHELLHLRGKFKKRCPDEIKKLDNIDIVESQPLFYVVEGEVEPWEKAYKV